MTPISTPVKRFVIATLVVLTLHATVLWLFNLGLSQPLHTPVLYVDMAPLQVVTTRQAQAAATPEAPQDPVRAPAAAPKPQAPARVQAPTQPVVPIANEPTTGPTAPSDTGNESPSNSVGTSTSANSASAAGASSGATAPGSTGSNPNGNTVVKPSTAGGEAFTPKPVYPALARRLGIRGNVVVRLWVEADGRVTKANVAVSSGESLLDESALSTVLTWRFVPGTVGGVAQGMWHTQSVQFVLR